MSVYQANPHVLAEAWRLSLGLSRDALSRLTGYSAAHIRNMERGTNASTGAPIPPRSFNRYRMACAAVHANLDFDWRGCSIRPRVFKRARS
jgi:transcriptional regulator with XRE-family HTH domain